MPTHLTLALAGHAANSTQNCDSSLSDLLHLAAPDDDGYRPLPDRYASLTGYILTTGKAVPDGLLNALDVLLGIEGEHVRLYLVTDKITDQIEQLREYVDDIHEEEDPAQFLIGVLHDSPGSRLLLNLDPTGRDDDLVHDVHAAGGIPIRNLAKGLTEIAPPENEEQEAEEPEEETAAAPPQQTLEELPEEDRELEEAPPAAPAAPTSLEEDVAAAQRGRTTQTSLAIGEVKVDTAWLRELYRILDNALQFADSVDLHNAAKNLSSRQASPLTQGLQQQVRHLDKLLAPEQSYTAVAEAAEKQQTPTAKSAGKRARVLWDDDKNDWVKTGRGRVRDGVKIKWMDEAGNLHDAK